MKSKVALSIEQMNELKALGIDITDASLAWVPLWKEDKKTIEKYFLMQYSFGNAHKGYVPAYTLEDLLRKMPLYIPSLSDTNNGYILRTGAANPKQYYCAYEAIDEKRQSLMTQYSESLIDCIFIIFKGLLNYRNICAKLLIR